MAAEGSLEIRPRALGFAGSGMTGVDALDQLVVGLLVALVHPDLTWGHGGGGTLIVSNTCSKVKARRPSLHQREVGDQTASGELARPGFMDPFRSGRLATRPRCEGPACGGQAPANGLTTQQGGPIPPQGILPGEAPGGGAQARQEGRDVYGYGPKKKEFQDRLRRIEGQVRGLQRMVDEDQYCIDILTQVNSVTSALKAVAMGLLDEHVRHCVRESIERGEGDEKMEELMSAVARFAGR
jgi:CsoR family transcriptional regulator, copper-sensing transcriptional repressor